MPDLPTLTVSQAQATRLLEAFGTTAQYKDWLKTQITAHVLQYENAKIEAATAAFHKQKVDEIADLVLEETP